MTTKLFRLQNHLIKSYINGGEAIKSKLAIVQNKFVVPERLKGTIAEKWLLYWKNLYKDYRDVFIDVGKQTKDHPIRSTFYISSAAAAYYAFKRNPSETDFYEQLRKYTGDLVLVHESCQNPIASEYFKFLERCYNEGIIRRLSIGICSFLWIDNYDKALSLYKTTCTHLQPDYLMWHKRIIDVGFLNTWWTLKDKMIDYDVNENNL